MNIIELALMGSLLGGSHTLGHFNEAQALDVPVKFAGLSERYQWSDKSNKDKAKIHGAGFRLQEKINKRLNSKEASIANAIYKGAYLAGLPMMADKNIKRGDIKDIKADVGGVPDAIIGATMIADILKAAGKMKNTSLSFTQNRNGTPMLQYSRKLK